MSEWTPEEMAEGLRSFSGTDARERFYEACAEAIESQSCEGKLKDAVIEAVKKFRNPDWSMLEATQESLREHMCEIKSLREAMTRMRRLAGKGSPIDNIGKFAMKDSASEGLAPE